MKENVINKARVALRKYLEQDVNKIETSWEGELYKEKNGIAYQDVKLILSDKIVYGVSELGCLEAILSINLFYPSNEGTFKIEKRLDELNRLFYKGLKLTNEDIFVIVARHNDLRNLGTREDRIIRNISIYLRIT